MTVFRIPGNLSAALEELDVLLCSADIEALRSGEVSAISMHHTLGRYLRNNWGLWQGSVLAQWFNKQEIIHADDMSGIILDSYVRKLRNEPIKLDEQIKYYHDWWKEHKSA